ncbi:hypothetical protein [Acinetobacter brisouii]|nr:hypothetical protein [Acinetobacter brisouii]
MSEMTKISKFLSLVRRHQPEKNSLKFYQAENGVWLTKYVPAQYLSVQG